MCLVCTIVLGSTKLSAQNEWARADSAIVRLAPSRFPAIPAGVKRDLERRGCRIPQLSEDTGVREPHNVIRGAFTGPHRVDWAILCSVYDTSQILVYRRGGAGATDSLGRRADRDYLQGLTAERIGFSREIGIATAADIRGYAEAYDGPAPPVVLDHLGIHDAFWGKFSGIYYLFDGKWLKLQGSD